MILFSSYVTGHVTGNTILHEDFCFVKHNKLDGWSVSGPTSGNLLDTVKIGWYDLDAV